VQSPDALSKTPQAEVGGALCNPLQDQSRCASAIVMDRQRDRACAQVQTEHHRASPRVTFDIRERLASRGVQHFDNLGWHLSLSAGEYQVCLYARALLK
jgi:hypothetical protein